MRSLSRRQPLVARLTVATAALLLSSFASYCRAMGGGPPSPPPLGTVTTLAGQDWNPRGIAVSGSFALVAEYSSNRIRKIVLATKAVSTLVADSNLNGPTGVTLAPDGSFALVAEYGKNRILKVTVATKAVSTLAGSGKAASTDGTGTKAAFNGPHDVALSPDGKIALVADGNSYRVRKIVVATQVVTTVAGTGQKGFKDGKGDQARLAQTTGLAISPDGKFALLAEHFNHAVRRLVLATRQVSALAGAGPSAPGLKDASGANAKFRNPHRVAISPDGFTALVGDYGNHVIRKIVIATGAVSTLAGSGSAGFKDAVGKSAIFNKPAGVAFSADGSFALIADEGNDRIRMVAVKNSCKCDNGTPKSGSECTSNGASMCKACDSGFRLNSDKTRCERLGKPSCPHGTVANVSGGCIACAPGQYLSSGSQVCKNCSVGHYTSRGGQTQCLPCIGGVANTTGSKACTPCAPGRFIADQGQGYGCKPCPRGTGPVTNRTACETCRGIQFSACGLCQDCRPPNVKIDNATCIKTNTKCQPGTQPRNQASASSNRGDTCNGADLICSQCKAGSVSLEGRECVACNEGNKVSNDRQTVCESCSPGKEPSSDRSACNDCTGNKVSSFGTACTPCASNSIVSGNHTRCAECSQGQEPAQNQSICRCTKGRFNSSQLVVRCFGAQGFLNKQGPDAASATSECLGCPPCLDCFGGEMPLTTAGYRVIPRVRNSAVSVSQVHIFRCPYARSCLPAAVANETTVGSCLHGHTGVLCQGCVSGWSRAPGGRCYECLGGTLQWALLPALILVGLILLFLVLSKYLARKQKKREKEMGSSRAQEGLAGGDGYWESQYSHEHSRYFYVNRRTGEKSWSPPTDDL